MKLALVSVCALLCLCCFNLGSCLNVRPMTLQDRVGGTAMMTCVLRSTPRCSRITWSGPALTAGPSSRVTSANHFGVQLTIRDLRIEDQGSYTCACGENESSAAFLEVIRLPNFEGLDPDQNFVRGNTAVVRCNVFPGDPPSRPIWMRSGRTISNSYMDRYRLQPDSMSLAIEDIKDSDAGIFTCGFNTIMGYRSRNITVTVAPPNTPVFTVMINPDQRNLYVNYGNPLSLTCRVDVDPASVNISWIILGHTIVHNSTLLLQPEEVMTGFYTCFAHNADIERHRSVFVTVTAKPEFTDVRLRDTLVLKTSVGRRLEHNEATITTAPGIKSSINIQWTRKDNNVVVDFGSRFTATWVQQNIRWIISEVQLEDSGEYFMNVSNEFGYTVLSTKLVVSGAETVEVQVEISGQNCQDLKDHKDELARDIARAYFVICDSYCEYNHPADVHCTRTDHAIISLPIPREYYNLMVADIRFNLSGIPPFRGEVCSTDCTTTTVTPKQPHVSSEKNIMIIGLVLSVIFTVPTAVFIVTYLFCKYSRNRCNQHRVAELDAENPPINMEEQQKYERPSHKRNRSLSMILPPVTISTTVTPINESFPSSQQLHLPPSPKLAARKETCRASTRGTGKRPKELLIRSHSYHGYSCSGRTRTPPDSRSRERM